MTLREKLSDTADKVRFAGQARHERKLVKKVLHEYADDPTVTFVDAPPEPEDGPHGVNVPDEMAVTDAEPVAD